MASWILVTATPQLFPVFRINQANQNCHGPTDRIFGHQGQVMGHYGSLGLALPGLPYFGFPGLADTSNMLQYPGLLPALKPHGPFTGGTFF